MTDMSYERMFHPQIEVSGTDMDIPEFGLPDSPQDGFENERMPANCSNGVSNCCSGKNKCCKVEPVDFGINNCDASENIWELECSSKDENCEIKQHAKVGGLCNTQSQIPSIEIGIPNKEPTKFGNSSCASGCCGASKPSTEIHNEVSAFPVAQEVAESCKKACCGTKLDVIQIPEDLPAPQPCQKKCCDEPRIPQEIQKNPTPIVAESKCCSGDQRRCSSKVDLVVVDMENINEKDTTMFLVNVQGMTCSDCENEIIQLLLRDDRVVNVTCSGNNMRIFAQSAYGDISSELIDQIQKLGFRATLVITGTQFASFFFENQNASFIQDAMRKISSISAVKSCTLQNERIIISIDTSILSLKRTLKTIELDSKKKVKGILILSELPNSSQALQGIPFYRLPFEWMDKGEWNRVILSFVLSLPVIICWVLQWKKDSFGSIVSFSLWRTLTMVMIIEFVFTTAVLFIAGSCVYVGAWKAVVYSRRLNMDTLIALSTTTAYIYSVAQIIVQLFFVPDFEGESYFETCAILMTLILFGKALEKYAVGKGRQAMAALLDMQPKHATVVDPDEGEMAIPVEMIEVGDMVKAVMGEKIAVDGTVVRGECGADESLITGESLPVSKAVDSTVIAGSLITDGSIYFIAKTTASNNTIAKIKKRVEDAQQNRPRIEESANRVASWFIPFIFGLSIVSFTSWFLLAKFGYVDAGDKTPFVFAMLFAISILIVSCPCAIVLACPTAILAGITVAAKNGILFKSGFSLERLNKVTAIVLDKTGTITFGKPTVVECKFVLDLEEQHKNTVQTFLGSLENLSEHPIAKSIVHYIVTQKGLSIDKTIRDYISIRGKGARGLVTMDGEIDATICIGTLQWCEEDCNMALRTEFSREMILENIGKLQSTGKIVVFMGLGTEILGYYVLTDETKPESKQAIDLLQKEGIECWMLSGDAQSTAEHIGSVVGISKDRVIGHADPQTKSDFMKSLQKKRKVVAMVGDGVNDAAAMAQADVSIGMSSGSDLSLELAEIVLMNSKLTEIVLALDIAKFTMQRVWMNFGWAIVYNIITIPIATGILYPFLHVSISPTIAGVAELFSSVPVVISSYCLKFYKPKEF